MSTVMGAGAGAQPPRLHGGRRREARGGEPRLHAPVLLGLEGLQEPQELQGAGGEGPQRACPTAACLRSCGLVLDRDENVASNLLRFGQALVERWVYLPCGSEQSRREPVRASSDGGSGCRIESTDALDRQLTGQGMLAWVREHVASLRRSHPRCARCPPGHVPANGQVA